MTEHLVLFMALIGLDSMSFILALLQVLIKSGLRMRLETSENFSFSRITTAM